MEPILSLKTLQNELHGVRAKWLTLGVQLDIDSGTLKRIEQDGHDVGHCLLELLIEWRKGDPSWKNIVNALRSNAMGEQSLADDIEGKYCNCLSQSAPTSFPALCNSDSFQEQSFPDFVGDPQMGENSQHPIPQTASVPAGLAYAQQPGYRRISMPAYLPRSGNEPMLCYVLRLQTNQ